MNPISGVDFHFLRGFASGSFYMAFQKVGFADIFGPAEFTVFGWTYAMGVFWATGGGSMVLLKERDLPEHEKGKSIDGFSFVKGLIAVAISAIFSACFNSRIEAGEPMAEAAVTRGNNPLFQNNVTYVVLHWGTTNSPNYYRCNTNHSCISDPGGNGNLLTC
ncbi:MAG: L-rhamnose/proton symporter RhaT [Cyclobacteriaceae bacterium]